jgi:ribosome maturation factor RimP
VRRPKHPVVVAIEPQVEGMLVDYGYELVDITFGGPKRNPMLTIVVDKPGGVTADDCAAVSKHLNVLLDALDPIPTSYQLAVSSPGLERPLTKSADFTRFAGREAAIRFVDESGRPKTVTGELHGIRDGMIALRTEEGELRIPEGQAESAHLTYSWEQLDPKAE